MSEEIEDERIVLIGVGDLVRHDLGDLCIVTRGLKAGAMLPIPPGHEIFPGARPEREYSIVAGFVDGTGDNVEAPIREFTIVDGERFFTPD